MPIEITTLIENTQGEHTGLITEHGLSFLIETGKSSILFDTGRSNAFLKNAKLLESIAKWVFRNLVMHKYTKPSLTYPISAAGPCD